MGKADKGLKQQANMMAMVLGRINDIDYYVKEAQRERDMKDTTLPFCYDAVSGLYHVKGCSEIKEVPEEQLSACKMFPIRADICPRCYRRGIILQGMDDAKEKIFAYMDFFNTHGGLSTYIRKLVLGNQGKFKILGSDSILVTVRDEDTFRIEYSQKDAAFLIYHNNYVNNGSERYMLFDFHIEDGGYEDLGLALNKVSAYSWDKHLKNKYT